MPLTFEHQVECAANPEFAWKFWTNPRNWALDSDVASVELHGPFASGSEGITESRSAGKICWKLRSVERDKSAVVEIPLPDGVADFYWRFDACPHGTRITQRVSLEGPQAEAYFDLLKSGIPAGMAKLAQAIESSAANSQ
jgi:hypothetical protein